MRKDVNYELIEKRRQFRAFYNEKLKGKYEELEEKRQSYLRKIYGWMVLFVLILGLIAYSGLIKITTNDVLVMLCILGILGINIMLKDDHEEDEAKRKLYLKKNCGLVLWLVLVLGLIAYSGTIKVIFRNSLNSLCVFGIFGLGIVLIIGRIEEDFKKATKKLVMNKILSFWGDLTYKTCLEGPHSQDVLEQSGVFGFLTGQSCDDCFEGSYNDVKITVSEQELYDLGKEGKRSKRGTVFKGILISLNMPKQFKGQTVVRNKLGFMVYVGLTFVSLLAIIIQAGIKRGIDGGIQGVIQGIIYTATDIYETICDMGWFGNVFMLVAIYLSAIWGHKYLQMQRVNLEDVVFNKHWKVDTTDQIEARYVLTPAFMERMLEVKKRFKGKKIEFSFWNNKVLIAVYTDKDMFETTSLFTSALSYHKVQEVVEQFWAVFSMADLLMENDKRKREGK